MQSFKISKTRELIPFSLQEIAGEEEEVWLILRKEELLACSQYFKWQPRTLAACMKSARMPKVEVYEKYDYGIAGRLVQAQEKLVSEYFSFYIGRHYLVLVMEEITPWIEAFVSTLMEDKAEKYSVGYIFFRLLDDVIQADQNYLDDLLERIVQLEEKVFRDKASEFSKEMIGIRKHITLLKRHYDPLTDVIEDFESNENEICSKEVIRYFKILSNRMKRLNHQVDQMSEYTNHVREAYDAQVEIKQNRMMQYFTLLTSIFLPLTLITGWYGMNFEPMPELSWKYGYFYVIGLSLFSSVFCIYFFKKKRWM